MAKPAKKRLCWNCDGSVPLEAETCPYCGVSVAPASLDGNPHSFAPLYQPTSHSQTIPPTPPYTRASPIEEPTTAAIMEEESKTTDASYLEFKNVLWAVSLLLTGTVFFLFAITLLLFSHHGVLTLQWNADVWIVYFLLAIPCIFFGWRSWSRLE